MKHKEIDLKLGYYRIDAVENSEGVPGILLKKVKKKLPESQISSESKSKEYLLEEEDVLILLRNEETIQHLEKIIDVVRKTHG